MNNVTRHPSRLAHLFFIAAPTSESEFLAQSLRPYASLERFIAPTLALERIEMIERSGQVVLPDAIVTYEPRPYAFDSGFPRSSVASISSTEAIYEKMATLWPFVPRVTVGGAWCEGETRTGRPRRGEIRFELGEAIWALRHELPRLVSGASLWRFPSTTTDEESIQMNDFSFAVVARSVTESVTAAITELVTETPTTSASQSTAHRVESTQQRIHRKRITPMVQNHMVAAYDEQQSDTSEQKILYHCCEDRALAELLIALAQASGWTTCGIASTELAGLFSGKTHGVESSPPVHMSAVYTSTIHTSTSLAKVCVDIDSPEISVSVSKIVHEVDVTRHPTLFLTAFPRFDEIQKWSQLGIQVMPKPFQVIYLLDFLQSPIEKLATE